MTNRADGTNPVKIWDIGTRLFHWSLVILFALSGYSAFQDKFGIYADIHLWSGYGVLSLVCWRIVWGFVGSETSRFSHFVKNPKATAEYAKTAFKKAPYKRIGHNPLGALSVVVMLLLLLSQALMGLFASDGMFFSGPLADTIKSSWSSSFTQWHEYVGYTLFGLVGLHLLVIILMGVRRRTNLVAPMVTGHKKDAEEGAVAPQMASPLYALGLFTGIAGALYWCLF